MKGKTCWSFAPAGGQHRNGAPEAFVKKFKRSLSILSGDRKLSMLEMEVQMKMVAAVLNSWPIYAKIGPRGGLDPDYLTPITPMMLLTGRCNTELPVCDYDLSSFPLQRLAYVQELVEQWWNQWKCTHFPSLVPTTRWQEEQRNLCVGDVVLIKYETKSKPGKYCLGIVLEVEEDQDQLVRTVTVVYSLIQEVESSKIRTLKGVTKKKIRVPVQRFVLILPVEEQPPGSGAEDLPGNQSSTCREAGGRVEELPGGSEEAGPGGPRDLEREPHSFQSVIGSPLPSTMGNYSSPEQVRLEGSKMSASLASSVQELQVSNETSTECGSFSRAFLEAGLGQSPELEGYATECGSFPRAFLEAGLVESQGSHKFYFYRARAHLKTLKNIGVKSK